MKSISIISILILTSSWVWGDGLLREVTFNDGTRLVLRLKDQSITFKNFLNNNETKSLELNLSEINELHFTSSNPIQRLDKINELLDQLRDENFKKRENAAAKLGSLADGFQSILKTNIENSLDPEVRWRLQRVLNNLPPQRSLGFDQMRSKTNKFKGQIIGFSDTAKYHGSAIPLNRTSVKSIKEISDKILRSGHSVITDINSPEIPITNTMIDFNSSPEGKILRAGQNINRIYEKVGVSFLSLRPNSYLTVSPKEIEGIQRGNSATNHRPLFEGNISGRFCNPENPVENRAVSFLGLRVGQVKPGGTTLTAFDSNNKKIEATTNSDGNQFIGISSKAPITHFTINANSEIDPTFSFDDLIFTELQSTNGNDSTGRTLLTLKNGDRISCKNFIFPNNLNDKDKELIIFPSSESLEKLSIKLNKIAAIHFNHSVPQDENPTPHLWCLLNDNSKLKINYNTGANPTTEIGEFPLSQLSLNAIWPSGKTLIGAEEKLTIPHNGAAILIRKDPVYVENYEIKSDSFEGTRKDSSKIKYIFSRMPSVWLNNSAEQLHLDMALTLIDGQKINFSSQSLFSYSKFTEKGVTLKLSGNKVFSLPFEKILSIYF